MGDDDAVTELVRRVVRGESSYRELTSVGFEISLDPPALRGGSMPLGDLSLSDLATGLLHHWTLGTELRDWAIVMLMASDIQFVEAETPDEEALLDAVWSASANEPLSDDSIAVVLRLASA